MERKSDIWAHECNQEAEIRRPQVRPRLAWATKETLFPE